MKLTFKLKVVAVSSLLLLFASPAFADLSQKQARKAISKVAGFVLPTSAVRVRRITSTGNADAEVSAELELVFKLTRNADSVWRIREIRTGEARWDNIETINRATRVEFDLEKCHSRDSFNRWKNEGGLTNPLARCLIANLFSAPLPSDAVRIKELSSLNLGSEPSALAIALVHADFRLNKDKSGWRAIQMRTGNRDWVNLESVPSSIDELKRQQTSEDMNQVAAALEAYRKDRGSFVVTDKHHVVIDHLNPRYLTRVIRTDRWFRPLRYQGDAAHFTLRSLGQDGKENTADDIVVTR